MEQNSHSQQSCTQTAISHHLQRKPTLHFNHSQPTDNLTMLSIWVTFLTISAFPPNPNPICF